MKLFAIVRYDNERSLFANCLELNMIIVKLREYSRNRE